MSSVCFDRFKMVFETSIGFDVVLCIDVPEIVISERFANDEVDGKCISGLCMYWLLSPLMKSCSSVGSVAIGNVEQRWVSVMSAGGSSPMIIVEGWR